MFSYFMVFSVNLLDDEKNDIKGFKSGHLWYASWKKEAEVVVPELQCSMTRLQIFTVRLSLHCFTIFCKKFGIPVSSLTLCNFSDLKQKSCKIYSFWWKNKNPFINKTVLTVNFTTFLF